MNDFKTSPNQKTIQIKKEKTDKENYYCKINLSALELAAIDLKSGAFKLWVYLSKNQDNYTFALSNKAVAEQFGIKKDQYDSAVKELITKGYLIETSKNHFQFKELAEKTTIQSGEKPQKEVVKNTIPLGENRLTNIKNITDNITKEKTFIF